MNTCRVEGRWFLWLAAWGFAETPVQAQKPDLWLFLWVFFRQTCIFCDEWNLKWSSTALLLAVECLPINSVFQSILISRSSFYLMTAPSLLLSSSLNCFLKEQFKKIYKHINLLSNNYGNVNNTTNDKTCWEIHTYSLNAEICKNLLWLYFYCSHSV